MASRTVSYTMRCSPEWLEEMKQLAGKTPLCTSMFIRLAAEQGADDLIRRLTRNEELQSDVSPG